MSDGQGTEKPPRAWVDREGYPWLEAEEGRAFCYDEAAQRKMAGRWPSLSLEAAGLEFGPLEPLGQDGQGQETEDRTVFLYGGGKMAEVPRAYGAARGWQDETADFTEVVPGWSMALAAQGCFWVSDDECAEGVFVVVRRTGP